MTAVTALLSGRVESTGTPLSEVPMLVAPTSSETRSQGPPEAFLTDLLRAGQSPRDGLRPMRGALYGIALGGVLWASAVGVSWIASSLL